VLSYASYALDNWRRLDPNAPIELGNIVLLQNFLAGLDEEWFILIHVDIEAKAARAIRQIPTAIRAAESGDLPTLTDALREVAAALEAMYAVLARMPEACDPYIYYHRVRPYIHGWKNNPALPNGVVYEGVEAYGGQPQQFRGETGAQSSIIPTLDGLLGIQHADDPLKTYLMEMRLYMPPAHRRFLEAVEARSRVREVVQASGDPTLRDAYNACVDGIQRFRALHLEYAAQYIYKQQAKDAKNPTRVGTGGTPFMKYLKKHRDESGAHRLE
jgi:indoleamine 2,3-dioxygenase